MSRLPPVEKLPLAVRKDLRDNWDAKKPELEKELSDILGEPWTIEVDPLQIYAYATEGYAKESTGSMLKEYITSLQGQLKYFFSHDGDDAKKEINTICSSHVVCFDLDVDKKFSYCGCVVSDGKLAILFREGRLAVNINDAASEQHIVRALNEAPSSLPMNYESRRSVRGYETDVAPVKSKLNEQLGRTVELKVDFEALYAALSSSKDVPDMWQANLASFVKMYFDSLADAFDYQKVKDDEMVREAVNEAAEKGVVVFRFVEQGQMKESYNEAVFDEGVLYLQTVPKYFGTNIHQVAQKITDQL